MVVVMMSQAQDRDKRREKREERCQEFCIQIEMQRQQMQNQQNMMAVIMMSMMGWNTSVSVPNEGIMNMLAGGSNEQCNEGQGGSSNDDQTEEKNKIRIK